MFIPRWSPGWGWGGCRHVVTETERQRSQETWPRNDDSDDDQPDDAASVATTSTEFGDALSDSDDDSVASLFEASDAGDVEAAASDAAAPDPDAVEVKNELRRRVLDLYLRTFWVEPRRLAGRIEDLADFAVSSDMLTALQTMRMRATSNTDIKDELTAVWAQVSDGRPLTLVDGDGPP
jgi:hypothetical protein